MDDYQIKNDKRRLMITSVVIILVLLAVGFGVFELFTYAYEQTMKDRMQDEVYRYENQISAQIDQDFQMMNTMAAFFGSAESIQNEQYFNILQRVDDENDFLTLGVFNLEGNGLISDREAKKVYDYKVSEMKDEARSVIEKALQGKESMSNEFIGALTEKDVVMFAVPIYSDGNIVGCTVASTEISVFSEVVENNNVLYGSGSMSLIDGKGNFLIRGQDSGVEDQKKSILSESEDSNLNEYEINNIIEAMAKRERIEFNIVSNNERYNVLLSPLEYNNWYLLCTNSFSQSSKGLLRLELTLLVFFIVIILVFSLLLSYWYKSIKKGNEKLYQVVYFDQLTNVYTMTRFSYLVKDALQSASSYAICVFDIRQFLIY